VYLALWEWLIDLFTVEQEGEQRMPLPPARDEIEELYTELGGEQ